VKVKVSDDKVTGVGGVALWGPMLDNLNLVGVADGRRLRPIGPGGYTGGECYRALVEILLAGGDFLSDRSLLDGADPTVAGRSRVALTRDDVPVLWRSRFWSGPESRGGEPDDVGSGVGVGCGTFWWDGHG
jgi:hypothetical protein